MEDEYLIDFDLAYEFEMKLSSIHGSSYFANEASYYFLSLEHFMIIIHKCISIYITAGC